MIHKPNGVCGNCKFWGRGGRLYGSDCDEFGECHRLPPTFYPGYGHVQSDSRLHERGIWPRTLEHDWCADFQPLPGRQSAGALPVTTAQKETNNE
jgi:hypothetical protein